VDGTSRPANPGQVAGRKKPGDKQGLGVKRVEVQLLNVKVKMNQVDILLKNIGVKMKPVEVVLKRPAWEKQGSSGSSGKLGKAGKKQQQAARRVGRGGRKAGSAQLKVRMEWRRGRNGLQGEREVDPCNISIAQEELL
jgi:hypothetical protein